MLRRILLDGLKTGVALAATTTAAIMFFSRRAKGSPWAGVNAIAHVVEGGYGKIPRRFSPRDSAIGLAVHGISMIAWGLAYRGAVSVVGARGVVPAGIATLAIGFVDYELLPARFSPGIERVLGPLGVGATFATLGATLAASDLFTGGRRLLTGPHDEGEPESWFV